MVQRKSAHLSEVISARENTGLWTDAAKRGNADEALAACRCTRRQPENELPKQGAQVWKEKVMTDYKTAVFY